MSIHDLILKGDQHTGTHAGATPGWHPRTPVTTDDTLINGRPPEDWELAIRARAYARYTERDAALVRVAPRGSDG